MYWEYRRSGRARVRLKENRNIHCSMEIGIKILNTGKIFRTHGTYISSVRQFYRQDIYKVIRIGVVLVTMFAMTEPMS
jgi:hypothetical protein